MSAPPGYQGSRFTIPQAPGVNYPSLRTAQAQTAVLITAAPFLADPTGTADSAAQIQAAINAAAKMNTASGQVIAVLFPPGIFLVGSTITLPQNVVLLCEPKLTTIRQKNGANLPAVFQTGNCTNGVLTSFVEWTNIYIGPFIFDGNGSNQTYGAMQAQCFMVLYGSNITVDPNARFINCGGSAAANSQTPTGLLLGSSVENPANGSRLRASHVTFENCYGVASWLTNAKGGFTNTPGPDAYGTLGNNAVDFQTFWFCKNGLYIEDRCNGVSAYGIQFYGDPANTATAGAAVSILFSSNIMGSVYAQYASTALNIQGSPAEPSEGVIFDAFGDTCANPGIILQGQTAIVSTVTANTAANSPTLPLTVTAGTVAGNTWLLIQDGAKTEWVQVGSFTAGVATLLTNTQFQHNAGVSVVSDSGLRHVQGRFTARNCGSLVNAAGIQITTVYDSVLTVNAYDTRQYLSPPGTSAPGITQFQGILIGNKCQRVQMYGNLYANRDWAVNDDGTNSECPYNGIVGQVSDNGTHQVAHAARLTYDPTLPSEFYGTGAPANTLGKNGDFYFRDDGGAGTAIYQRRAGAWVGIV